MRLNIVRYPTIIRPAFMDCIRPTLDVLNEYLDINSQRSLQYPQTIHSQQMSSSKTPLRTTRKA